MDVQSLGYVGVRAEGTEEWTDFGRNLLGLQLAAVRRSISEFRMDDRAQRIIVDGRGGQGIAFFGWELADGRALDTIAAKLDASGTAVERGSRGLADERHVKDLIVCSDPFGNRLEFFHGGETASASFTPGRSISGFRTGRLGLGHAVLTTDSPDNTEKVIRFYRDVLGFRLTDYYTEPFTAYFMHLNPRHHSLAFVETGKVSVHHIMMELFSLDDVGQALDIANSQEGCVATTLGRHTSDFITSFYMHTPSGFMVEYGWGARSIDPESWSANERKEGPSLWGHERSWLPEKERKAAHVVRRKLAAEGVRRPVQVIEGNYELNPGRCPWLDTATHEGVADEAAVAGAIECQR